MVRLGDVGRIVTGNTPSTSNKLFYESNDIPFYKPIDFTESIMNKLINSASYVSFKAKEKVRLLPNRSVLTTCIGTIGKVGVLGKTAACNQQINAIIVDEKKAESEFIAYSILSRRKYLQSIANAPVVPIINKTQFSNIEIPLPPLEVQKKIAQTLDVAAELITLRKKQLAELDQLIKATFYDMFGDPVTNEKGWEVRKLGDIGELARGISKHRPRNDPKLLGGRYPLIQTGDIANAGLYINKFKQTYSELGLLQSKMWDRGTLCITIAANIAKTAILGFNACFPDSIVGFKPDKFTNIIYIYTWFQFFQKVIEEQAPESAQKNINLRILNDLNVVSPPLDLQNKFAAIVTKIEEQKALVQQAIDESQYLFDSLMSEYFD